MYGGIICELVGVEPGESNIALSDETSEVGVWTVVARSSAGTAVTGR